MATVSMGLRSRARALKKIQESTFDKSAAQYARRAGTLTTAVYLDYVSTQMQDLTAVRPFLRAENTAVSLLHGIDQRAPLQKRYDFWIDDSHQPNILEYPSTPTEEPRVTEPRIKQWGKLLAGGATPEEREESGFKFYSDDIASDLSIKAIAHVTQLGEQPLTNSPSALKRAVETAAYALPPWFGDIARQLRADLVRSVKLHMATTQLFIRAKTANHIVGVLPHAIHYLESSVVARMMASEKNVSADQRAFKKLGLAEYVTEALNNFMGNIPMVPAATPDNSDAILAMFKEIDENLKTIKTQETIKQLMQRK